MGYYVVINWGDPESKLTEFILGNAPIAEQLRG